jgi:hypothetical protein
MVNEHAICHEAGHATVAMNFGLNVTEICVKQSIPTAMFNMTNATTWQAWTVYAGGAAAEKIAFGGFGDASNSDRLMISNAGGGRREDHLEYAMQILRANPLCHREMWSEMSRNWTEEEDASIWSGSNSDKLNFVLLTGTRVREIWLHRHS